MPEDNLRKLEDQLKYILQGDEEKLRHLYGDKSLTDIMFENIKTIIHALKDKEQLIKFFKQLVPLYLQNYDILLINDSLVDKKLLEQFQVLFGKANQLNPTGFKEITMSYVEDYKTKYPIDKFSWTLLLYQKNYGAIYEIIKITPVLEMAEKFESFLYKFVEENQEDQFKLYFFDWVLKFGYLIEAYIKSILMAQVRLNYLLMGKRFTWKYAPIGWLLRHLGENRILSFYRNSIFHSTFFLDYKVNLNERKVIFFGKYRRKKEVSIREFIESFFTLLQVVYTFLISIFVFTYNLNKDNIIAEIPKILEMLLSNIEKVDFNEESFPDLEVDEFLKGLKEAMERGVF